MICSLPPYLVSPISIGCSIDVIFMAHHLFWHSSSVDPLLLLLCCSPSNPCRLIEFKTHTHSHSLYPSSCFCMCPPRFNAADLLHISHDAKTRRAIKTQVHIHTFSLSRSWHNNKHDKPSAPYLEATALSLWFIFCPDHSSTHRRSIYLSTHTSRI